MPDRPEGFGDIQVNGRYLRFSVGGEGMINNLRIEITPVILAKTAAKRLKIELQVSGKPTIHFEQHSEPDDFVSFFDQIFDCAKSQILKHLEEKT